MYKNHKPKEGGDKKIQGGSGKGNSSLPTGIVKNVVNGPKLGSETKKDKGV